MQNCKSSVGTAAKQSSKSSLLFRQPCILAMLLLCAVFSCKEQNYKAKETNEVRNITGEGNIIEGQQYIGDPGENNSYIGYPPLGGEYNILIGDGAGKFLTNERYCVIVGHDSIHVNSKGRDMIWIVDWNEPYLIKNPDIKVILLHYYNSFIETKKDSKDYRAGLALSIINRNNVSIGKDGRVSK